MNIIEKAVGYIKRKTHPNVGKVLVSPYYNRDIVVSSYVADDLWWFKFANADYREYKAGTRFSYFVANDLVKGGGKWK